MEKRSVTKKRYYSDGTIITGYRAIRDNQNEDEIIWVDCTEAQLKIFVDALNESQDDKIDPGTA